MRPALRIAALATLTLGLRCTALAAAEAVTRLEAAPLAEAADLPPLLCWPETWQTPRPVAFYVLRVDLHHPDVEVFTLLGDDPDGEGPAEAKLESPLSLAERLGAVAAVNANAFRHLPGADEAERRRGWYAGKLVDIAGLAACNGVLRSPPDGTLASFWVDHTGRPAAGMAPETTQVRHGVSAWIDHLIQDGQVVARPDTQLHPRTLLGSSADGRYLFMVVADGRQKGYSEGVSLTESAAFMRQLGCHYAVNLDGGGSSILVARTTDPDGATALRPINRPSGGRPRPIPVMFGVRRKTAPAAAAP